MKSLGPAESRRRSSAGYESSYTVHGFVPQTAGAASSSVGQRPASPLRRVVNGGSGVRTMTVPSRCSSNRPTDAPLRRHVFVSASCCSASSRSWPSRSPWFGGSATSGRVSRVLAVHADADLYAEDASSPRRRALRQLHFAGCASIVVLPRHARPSTETGGPIIVVADPGMLAATIGLPTSCCRRRAARGLVRARLPARAVPLFNRCRPASYVSCCSATRCSSLDRPAR